MAHIFKVVVNGNPYVVEIEEPLPDNGAMAAGTAETRVKVNGHVYRVYLERLAGPQPSRQVETAVPTELPPEDSVLEEDLTWDVSPDAGGGTFSQGTVSAPMPGNISNISVGVGEAVTRDQVLCTLEAMKMQNAIRSPRDGIIASVHVQSGQVVSYGDVLFVFE